MDASDRDTSFIEVQELMGTIYRFTLTGVEDVESRFCFTLHVSGSVSHHSDPVSHTYFQSHLDDVPSSGCCRGPADALGRYILSHICTHELDLRMHVYRPVRNNAQHVQSLTMGRGMRQFETKRAAPTDYCRP